mgnify:CR=1 FL=1
MLKIYIIWHDCPKDFGDKEIERVYMTREGARRYVKDLKGGDPYANQYLAILPMNVKIE